MVRIALMLVACVFACDSTTDLARQLPTYVTPAASSLSCASGMVSAAGWCCMIAPVKLCTPTPDAFADGLRLPVDDTAASEVKP